MSQEGVCQDKDGRVPISSRNTKPSAHQHRNKRNIQLSESDFTSLARAKIKRRRTSSPYSEEARTKRARTSLT